MRKESIKWEGCFAAVVTPFTENGELDKEAFCKNIELLIQEGIDGIVVCGCTGESWALTDEEKRLIFKLTVDQVKERVVTIGGTGEITPSHTIKLSRYAKDAGMDGVMIHPPARVIPNKREILGFYEEVSSSIDIPILLYNIIKRQGVDLSLDLIDRLADIENIVAIKESSNDFERVMEVIQIAGERIQVFTGHSAQRGVPAILMGAKGWVGSLEPQVMGKEAIDMYKHIKNGQLQRAKEIQYRCMALDKGMRGGRAGTFPAFVKYAMNLLGRPGGFPRKPVLPLTDEEKKHVQNVLKSINLL